MIRVEVYRKSDGKPVSGAKVSIGFDGILSGGFTDKVRTGSDGVAEFGTEGGRNGTIYINGSAAKKGRISGREVIHI